MNLYLKPEESKFLALAIVSLIDQMEEGAKNQRIPWNPEARKIQKEIIEAGTSVKIKFQKLGFNMSDLEPYKPGDEEEFFTKES